MPGVSKREALPFTLFFVLLLFLSTLMVPLSVSAQTIQQAQPATASRLITLDLALQWLPQSQFAGYYMAVKRGYYREVGLYLRLRHADGNNSSLALLERGEVQLATSFLTDAILAAVPKTDAWTAATLASTGKAGVQRQPDKAGSAQSARMRPEIVQIAQIGRRSNLLLVGWKELGITTAADLNGKKVSYWLGSFSAAYDTFFRDAGVKPVGIPQFYSVNLFLRKGVAACAAMEYNEYNRILQAGVEPESLTVFSLREQGFGFPEDGLYADAEWFEANREIAAKVRDATMKGWIYAREHQDEALDYVLAEARRVGISTNRPHEKWMLEHVLASIFVESGGSTDTSLSAADYAEVTDALLQTGMLKAAPELELFAPLSANAGTQGGAAR